MPPPAGTTLYPPPLVDFTCAAVELPLQVTPVQPGSHDIFTNSYPLWEPAQGWSVFGGIIIGQAIRAVYETVPKEFVIHHMQCTFHAPSVASSPLFYRVSHINDGRSSASREVKAEQEGKTVFSASCNFSIAGKKNPSLHQVGLPQAAKVVPKYVDNIEGRHFSEKIVLSNFLTHLGESTTTEDTAPFLWNKLPPVPNPDTTPSTNSIYSWVQSRGRMSANQASQMATLGCLTDSYFLLAIPLMIDSATKDREVGFMTTINNTIWFHDPKVRLDDWLFMERKTTWAAEGRCLLEQRIWSKDSLVATCVQEGVLKLKAPERHEKTAKVLEGEQSKL